MLGSNFALLVKSPGDDGQQLLTTGSRLVCISLVMTELLPAVGLCLHVWCVQCERVTSACSKLQCLSKYDSTSDSQKLLLVILIITYTVVQIIHNRTFRTRITSVHDAFGKTWILLTSYLNKLRCET